MQEITFFLVSLWLERKIVIDAKSACGGDNLVPILSTFSFHCYFAEWGETYWRLSCTSSVLLVLFCRESYGTTSENGDSGGKWACDNFKHGLSRIQKYPKIKENKELICKEGNCDEILWQLILLNDVEVSAQG